ncbi:MAG: EAL domain-containing protein [Pseudomonadota bacterium]
MSILNFIKNIFMPSDFRRQLLLVLITGILFTTFISTFVISNFTSKAVSEYLLLQGKKITENFASQTILGLLVDDPGNIEQALTATLNLPDIEGLGVYDASRKPLIELGKGTLDEDQKLWDTSTNIVRETTEDWYFVAPVYYTPEFDEDSYEEVADKELIGYVRIVQSKANLNQLVASIRNANLLISLTLAIAVLVLLLLVTQQVTSPLNALMRLMHKTQDGSYEHAQLEGPRDIRDMQTAFNSMIESLQDREEQLEKARDAALQSARVKGDFAANVSHELRTPLNGILGMLELLSDTGLSAKQREYVGIATNSSDALLALIDEILDFSKIDSGKMIAEPEEFNLRELLDEVVSIMATQTQAKNLDLAHLIGYSVPNSLLGDARRIRQLLLNLCGNAIKFTNNGEIAINVLLDEREENNLRLRFEVKDSGIGISGDAKEKIFEAFSQADESTTRKYGGTGLGLAICQQLVKVLGGDIGVDSKQGEGSTFWFVLPMQACDEDISHHEDFTGSMDLRILVVDDSEIVHCNIMQTLERWGAYVECADNCESAITKLRQATHAKKAFEIALIDEIMPTGNGIEMMREICRSSDIEPLKLILMTNQTHAESFLERFLEIDSFIQKPILQSSLFDCITTVMNGSISQVNPIYTMSEQEEFHANGAKVLVVEDNNANQQVAIGMLERLGCVVTVADNGLEAINQVSRGRYEIILMDCNMPIMDGYEATAKIRSIEGATGEVPIIAMTANVQDGERQKCLQAGMSDYLSKPIKLQGLKDMLLKWLPQINELIYEHNNPETITQEELEALPEHHSLNEHELNSSGPIDQERIIELRESVSSAFHQMVEAYLEDLPGLASSLEEAVNNKDFEQMQHFAHSIKGSSKNFGAVELAEVAKELEDMAKGNNLHDAHTLVIAIFEEIERVTEYLNKLVKPEDMSAQVSEVRDNEELQSILIADDDRSMRLALMNVLDSDGYELHEVSNGAEAYHYCKKTLPDLVLLDAMMPEMDGFDACQKIRELKNAKHTPILIVTALDDDDSVERAFRVGATDYLPKPVHFAVLRQRISRLLHAARVEKHVRHLAYTDPLTGLPNRTTLTTHLEGLLAKVREEHEMLAMLFLDLDRFKLVNDTLGHSVGDLLLKAVADRLQRCIRGGDMVARLGGDEFTVIIDRAKSKESVARIAQSICDNLNQPFSFAGQEIFVSTSIGVSLYPQDGKDIGELMKHADTAMFHAKEMGLNYFFYESNMEAEVLRKVEIEADLRRLVSRDEIDVYYQPKADVNSCEIVGMEALVRWNHPQKGIITPGEFVPLAEETGIINEIGLWVMVSSCLQAQTWIAEGYKPRTVAVNLSGIQLQRGNIIRQVEQVLDETQIDPTLLELEITESTIMHNPEQVIDILKKLKDIGVNLAVDDFGTGYSSLNYLKKFPIDLLKIDAAFVKDVESNPDDRAIIKSIIALAKTMRLKVVAEGVETRKQEQILKNFGCDYIQGYYIGRPLCSEEFERQILSKEKHVRGAVRDLSDFRNS